MIYKHFIIDQISKIQNVNISTKLQNVKIQTTTIWIKIKLWGRRTQQYLRRVGSRVLFKTPGSSPSTVSSLLISACFASCLVYVFLSRTKTLDTFPQILQLSASVLASNWALMLWMRVGLFVYISKQHLSSIFNHNNNNNNNLIAIVIVRSRCLPWVQDQGQPRDL